MHDLAKIFAFHLHTHTHTHTHTHKKKIEKKRKEETQLPFGESDDTLDESRGCGN